MVDLTAETDKNTRAEAFFKQTEREGRGHLTVFLGAAAGVGKTCAMLKAARSRMEEGVDVVIQLGSVKSFSQIGLQSLA